MNTAMNIEYAAPYNSKSQRARALTEGWVAENLYCPCCGNASLEHFPNNQPVADFFCRNCKAQFELKSKNGVIGEKVNDGAYKTMIKRIGENDNPNFLFMSYSMEQLVVRDLIVVPRFFLTQEIIEKRKALSAGARRAGWVGCNILFGKIPMQGRIRIIKESVPRDSHDVVNDFKETEKLQIIDVKKRSWFMDVLECVNQISSEEFSLADVYMFSDMLKHRHPDNHNIEAKIRQQLQCLRERDVIEFLGRGRYSRKGKW